MRKRIPKQEKDGKMQRVTVYGEKRSELTGEWSERKTSRGREG